jgi:hypothetical protein
MLGPMTTAITNWDDVTAAAPDLAALVRARFEATGLGLLATLRHDGSPRLSGIEPLFSASDLWLGMMDGSRKSADLRRDPRCGVHSATVDKQVTEGDVKVYGRALLADAEAKERYLAAFAAANGYAPTDQSFDLYRLDVTEVSSIQPGPGPTGETDHLVIRWWTPAGGEHRVERR